MVRLPLQLISTIIHPPRYLIIIPEVFFSFNFAFLYITLSTLREIAKIRHYLPLSCDSMYRIRFLIFSFIISFDRNVPFASRPEKRYYHPCELARVRCGDTRLYRLPFRISFVAELLQKRDIPVYPRVYRVRTRSAIGRPAELDPQPRCQSIGQYYVFEKLNVIAECFSFTFFLRSRQKKSKTKIDRNIDRKSLSVESSTCPMASVVTFAFVCREWVGCLNEPPKRSVEFKARPKPGINLS